MKKGAIIVSGGMDSITLLYEYQEDIALAISFDYGSNHNAREIPFARLHCERLGIRHIVNEPARDRSHLPVSALQDGFALRGVSVKEFGRRNVVIPHHLFPVHKGNHQIT